MNMLRVGGTMVYESDDFYDLCDELGILRLAGLHVRQHGLPGRRRRLRRQRRRRGATAAVARLQARPCLAVLCGNSEGEQQAAMWGAPRERWSPRLFHEVLAGAGARALPRRAVLAVERARRRLPAQAERRHDVVLRRRRVPAPARRRAPRRGALRLRVPGVRQRARATTRCRGGPTVRVHHPAWKARTPRDLGAGWDFDDVRDHYLERLLRRRSGRAALAPTTSATWRSAASSPAR